jgi:hypothetical protein
MIYEVRYETGKQLTARNVEIMMENQNTEESSFFVTSILWTTAFPKPTSLKIKA